MNTIHETVFCNSPKKCGTGNVLEPCRVRIPTQGHKRTVSGNKKIRPCGNKERTGFNLQKHLC